ncbi:LIM and calponin homology domains-containing protein 1-like isoform X1 [Cyclopterus lumpus]|uniref:LIM and calponin homology domains-containing protein 1-like isoform X1 n=1 Tax=Cyclopterus lumpus TaxID=8103 RepID=UPI001486CBBB|nr:LIM and calponin homology domains-containing protein 1-like isoform X1 [Cyclopterus lumpus]
MRKGAEEAESPKRSIRDSGYIDCWDSERSDSLSPPRHGREDSFDSLDSFGSRSRQTPSPDVLVPRGSSDGRGSDSESDGAPHRKVPDVRKDDMSARRTSISEPRTAVPFNQYLPNRSNQSGYVPTPLRKKKSDKEDGARKSWSTATSPVAGERPFSTPARSCSEELFHHSTARGASAAATPAVAASSVKHPPVTEQQQQQQQQQQEEEEEEEEEEVAASVRKGAARGPSVADEKRSRRTPASPKHVAVPSPPHFLPVPAATATATTTTTDTGRRKGRALSECDDPQRGNSWLDSGLPATFSRTHSASDDTQSVSMIDMRGEEEAILQPHSQVRHELMHNQYNRRKEEDDHWQDDLARWKNRRRSISQDLIKKEEERKMMEQLMSGGPCPSQRRRSIKTYREIVEEKERREDDLRDAYRRARTHEEAALILQHYAQRFSISETVLERLQLPKLLDRSVSADPSLPCSFPLSVSPTTPDPFDVDPDGPMRYLRQQSAPAPKFTSTLEARIEEFPKELPHQRPQIRSRSSEPPSGRTLSPKPVPLLTPKPYLQPWTCKADGLFRVNGDIRSGDVPTTPESLGRESPPHFLASPSKTSSSAAGAPSPAATAAASPTRGPLPSTGGEDPASSKAEEKQRGSEPSSKDVHEERVAHHSAPPSRPNSLPSELQKPEESFGETGSHSVAAPEEEKSNAAAPPADKHSNVVQSGVNTRQSQLVALQASVPSPRDSSQRRENLPSLAAPGSFEYHPPRETTAEIANSVRSPLATSNPKLRWEFFVPPEEMDKDRRGNVSVPVLPQARRTDRWSWDPDEERKRQERWQQEQERMLQEKYRREQEKLKEEWEKAQREVAEEERKYHEEHNDNLNPVVVFKGFLNPHPALPSQQERRILEDTVVPLTPRGPSALPSPSRGEVSSTSEPRDAIVRSLADWERKQELLERQSRGSTESVEWKRRENDRTSDISTADDSMKTVRSSVSQSSSRAETHAHGLQNGQKLAVTSTKTSTAVKKREEPSADGNKPGRPAGDRRSGPIDHNMCRSSSKPPAACPPCPDSLPPAPNRSVSGKKLCSSCGQPLGKGAAMIIETLSLYFHIHCFKCGVCKGQLGDTTTGTDVRIRNGLLNCHQCYIGSRSAGQPTTL